MSQLTKEQVKLLHENGHSKINWVAATENEYEITYYHWTGPGTQITIKK